MKGAQNMNEILFKRVTELCEKTGTSKRKLQEELGMSVGSLSKWKTSTPNTTTLQAVADYFGVTIDYLTGKSPYMNQDHMIKCWEEKYGNTTNKPDVMLPDGTIVEFKGMNNSVTLRTTGGNVEYTYIDPETRQLAEKIMNDDQLRYMVEHLTNLSQPKINALYELLRVIDDNN